MITDAYQNYRLYKVQNNVVSVSFQGMAGLHILRNTWFVVPCSEYPFCHVSTYQLVTLDHPAPLQRPSADYSQRHLIILVTFRDDPHSHWPLPSSVACSTGKEKGKT